MALDREEAGMAAVYPIMDIAVIAGDVLMSGGGGEDDG